MTVLTDLAYSLSSKKRTPYDRQREWGYGMLKQSMNEQPIDHPLQGVARLAQALVGGWATHRADQDEKAADKRRLEALSAAMAEPNPQKRIEALAVLDPEHGARYAGQWAIEQAKLQEQRRSVMDRADTYGIAPPASGPPAGNLPPDYSGRVAALESGNQMVPNRLGSGAFGPYQFMPDTWATVRAQNPDLNLPADPRQATPQQHSDAHSRFAAANGEALSGKGHSANPANLYLAHRFGPEGAAALLSADPNMPLDRVLPPQWLAQNPDMRGKTAGQFIQYAQAQMQGVGANPNAGVPANAPPTQISSQGVNGVPASPPGQPPAPQPGVVAGPNVAPQPPAPPRRLLVDEAPRELIAPYVQAMRTGRYGIGADAETKMRADIQMGLDKHYEEQKLLYDQRAEAFRHDRGRVDKAAEHPESFKKLETESRNLAAAIDNFETVIKEAGGGSWRTFTNDPTSPQAQKVLGAYQGLKTALRSEAFVNTGVLQPGENRMLEEMLLSPESIRGFLASPEAYSAKLNEFRKFIDGKMGAAYQAYNLPRPAERFSREQVPPAGGRSYTGPDGRAISQADIEATAKARGISPDDVIRRLGLRPAQ